MPATAGRALQAVGELGAGRLALFEEMNERAARPLYDVYAAVFVDAAQALGVIPARTKAC